MAADTTEDKALPTFLFKANADNKICFDCGSDKISAVVLAVGAFVCKRCSTLHTAASRRCKSILAMYTTAEINWVTSNGNTIARSVWMARWPDDQRLPTFASDAHVADFMRRKYVDGEFKDSANEAEARKAQLDAFRHFMEEEAREQQRLQFAKLAAAQEKRKRAVSASEADPELYGIARGTVRRERSHENVARIRSEAATARTGSMAAAAQAGNLEAVKGHIEAGVNVNSGTSEGDGALHRAAAYGQLEIVKYLLSVGASVRVVDARGNTPLHTAVETGHVDVIRALVEAGSSFVSRNLDGHRPVDLARSPEVRGIMTGMEAHAKPAEMTELRIQTDSDSMSRAFGIACVVPPLQSRPRSMSASVFEPTPARTSGSCSRLSELSTVFEQPWPTTASDSRSSAVPAFEPWPESAAASLTRVFSAPSTMARPDTVPAAAATPVAASGAAEPASPASDSPGGTPKLARPPSRGPRAVQGFLSLPGGASLPAPR